MAMELTETLMTPTLASAGKAATMVRPKKSVTPRPVSGLTIGGVAVYHSPNVRLGLSKSRAASIWKRGSTSISTSSGMA